MHFTKIQITELMRKHAEKENGLNDLMELMLESMMVAERSEFLQVNPQNKVNGYRLGHTYGQGRKLKFLIPRPLQHPLIKLSNPFFCSDWTILFGKSRDFDVSTPKRAF